MQSVRTPTRVSAKAAARVLAGRRLRAARMLADVRLRDAARSAGLSYAHVAAVERGKEPLTWTDCRDLGAVLGVPSSWLRDGWD